jgi:hypothetical protein
MKSSDIPFNIALLELTTKKLVGLRPVTALDTVEASTNNFHENGLFSVLTFGKVGDRRRNQRFSYIDIKIPVFHPVVYRALVGLKRMYAGIIAGNEYVLWNDEIGDFERSDPVNGKTGFHYFASHWKDIKFEQTKSVTREQAILLLHKYQNTAMNDKIVVIPAGLRDAEFGEDGRLREDEINDLYRKLLKYANTISDASVRSNPEVINTARYGLQLTFTAIYELLENMIEGKKKLLLGNWASRSILNGTRNVITSMNTSTAYLGAPGSVGFNNTICGIYQALKGMMPVARYLVRHGFLSSVFQNVSAPVRLVNMKTLKQDPVMLKAGYFDRWATDEGIEKVLTSFSEDAIRNKPLVIEGRYIGLIYKGPDGTFRLMHDIDELPSSRNKEDVHPLTFCELLYLSGYKEWNKYPLFFTRYPITGIGSIYPSKTYVKTTVKSEVRRELDRDWEPMSADNTAYEFPVSDGAYVNSLVPHSAKLDRLTADFDGDTGSGNITYSDEAIAEVDDLLTKRRAYVGTDGRFTSSTAVSTVNLVCFNMTGD